MSDAEEVPKRVRKREERDSKRRYKWSAYELFQNVCRTGITFGEWCESPEGQSIIEEKLNPAWKNQK